MSNRWASGSIAGVALVDSGSRDLRVDLLDAEAFHEAIVGDAVESLNLTVHTQLLSRNLASVHFGVRIAQMPSATWTAIISAIETAMLAGNPFPVVLADTGGVDSVSVLCVPDWAANGGKQLARQGMAAGYIKEVTMRFISTGAYTP